MVIEETAYLEHYGILRKSGRYPWGSGKTQTARNRTFLDTVEDLKNKGLSETEIAKGFDITTTELRAARSIARNEQDQIKVNQAQRLKDKGYSNVAIGERMGINESSVRSLLEPGRKDRLDVLETTSRLLQDKVDKYGIVDIGKGTELHLGVTATKLQTAAAMAVERGYTIHTFKQTQLGTGEKTNVRVLAKPGMTYRDVVSNRDKIHYITDHSSDGGRTFDKFQTPISVNSRRIKVKYAEDGGSEADGLILIRPGAKDLSLGKANYAQVRIAVDGTHYLKGMAVYDDTLPQGTDIVFHTNKSKSNGKLGVMKPLADDPDLPFGAVVKQLTTKENGKTKLTSAINIVNEEGVWSTWKKSLPSQMLSKQRPELAKTQLDMTYEKRRSELRDIQALTNPAIRKRMLRDFAEGVDSSAVNLAAHYMPRQNTHVLIPIRSMKDNEVYAPNYKNGERVALIRFPHGGTFEIPELKVNNRQPEAKRLLGQAPDAIGINSKVAERLSGADFDGDTVLVIPNNRKQIISSPALAGLKDFDPRASYPAYEGMKPITNARMQDEMGKITNLIADMTLRGANSQELARAVRHSMVVIDSHKHNLDYKGSAQANGIAQLKEKYQGGKNAGASTLITRATSEQRVPQRQPRRASKGGPIDPRTGKKVFEETGATYTNRSGKVVSKTTKSTKLAETDDAFTLVSESKNPIERIYAEHSNRLKALANEARKEIVSTPDIVFSPSAKRVYANEVASLNHKLNVAKKNAPLERRAQLLAGSIVSAKRQANPNLSASDLKKIKAQALNETRIRTGAKKQRIQVTPKEWEAIQAGAIRKSKLEEILDHSDREVIKELAKPRTNPVMTSVKQARAKAMLGAGFTQAEVAEAIGVPLSTLTSSLAA